MDYWVEQFYHKVREYHDRHKKNNFKFIDDEDNYRRRNLRTMNHSHLID